MGSATHADRKVPRKPAVKGPVLPHDLEPPSIAHHDRDVRRLAGGPRAARSKAAHSSLTDQPSELGGRDVENAIGISSQTGVRQRSGVRCGGEPRAGGGGRVAERGGPRTSWFGVRRSTRLCAVRTAAGRGGRRRSLQRCASRALAQRRLAVEHLVREGRGRIGLQLRRGAPRPLLPLRRLTTGGSSASIYEAKEESSVYGTASLELGVFFRSSSAARIKARQGDT
jgi:hypothetical protein